MKINAKLNCQNMQKNTTLQENELKIPAKFGTSIQTGGGTTVQADWAQNDPAAADFVKNRPGGYYGDPVTVDEEIYSGTIEEAATEMEVDWLLVAGQTYKVTIGEVDKTYTAFADAYSGILGVTIGDGTLEDAEKSGEMFALFSAEIEAGKVALLACPEADVGKTIRVKRNGTAREVHKIPAVLLDLDVVDKSMMQMSANIKELGNQHASDISSINKTLTEGPITFKRGSRTLELGKYDANNGLILRWDDVNGGYTMLSGSGLVAKYSNVDLYMTVLNVALVEKTHNSGIHFKLERSDINGGTRFVLDNVAGDTTTFYASGKIVNSNKLLQLTANDTITEDDATTLRGVKTPEQDFDAANKKYVDQRLPSPATAQVGQIVKVKSVDETGKITETETVDMPSAEKWEIIKTVEIADDAEETNALTINTDNDGNAFSLKKARLIQHFPKYTGETTLPNWSFTMVNGITSGVAAPLVYTSGLTVPNKSGNAIGVYEIDLTMPEYQAEQAWRWGGMGARGSFVPYYGPRTLNNAETITSIGGTVMLIYPGCKFILYGVRA